MKKDKVREWINTSVAVVGLCLLIYGTIWGVDELKEINVNLKNFTAESGEFGLVKTSRVIPNCPNGSKVTGELSDLGLIWRCE